MLSLVSHKLSPLHYETKDTHAALVSLRPDEQNMEHATSVTCPSTERGSVHGVHSLDICTCCTLYCITGVPSLVGRKGWTEDCEEPVYTVCICTLYCITLVSLHW